MKYITKAGNVRLQINDVRDVFFAGEVMLGGYVPFFEALIGIPAFTFGKGEFWKDGTRHAPYRMCFDGCQTVIKGYYEDSINKQEGTDTDYEVKIYIEYEV